MEINILYETEPEPGQVSTQWLRSVVEAALAKENTDSSSEVSIVITGQEKIRELNRIYLAEDRPTDVLSFPMFPVDDAKTGFVAPPDGLIHLGEIIISLPQAIKQAAEHGHRLERELAVLLIHGVLHLLGYDHAEPDETQKMQESEKTILISMEKLGLI